ncbi:MAG: lysylphosphatidylglycerol synthase transmembrane domain-containing protein [Actinomycetes bacterium]
MLGRVSDDGSTAAAAPPSLDPKKTIIGAIIGVATLVLIFWKVIPRIGSYDDAWIAIQGMTWQAIVFIGFAVVVYNVAYGFPFMMAVPGLSYGKSFQLNQGEFAIGNGVPAGGAFGLGLEYAMLASYRVKPAVATAAIGAIGVWNVFMSLGLPILGVVAIYFSDRVKPGPYIWAGIIGFFVLIVLVIVFGLMMRSQRLAESLGRLGNRIAGPIVARFKHGERPDFVPPILSFRDGIADLVRKRWHTITLSELAVSLTQFLIMFAALRGVEGPTGSTPILAAFGAFAVAQIGMMIPLTPGGLGTVDAIMIALLTAMGVSSGNATAADLVWRASSYVPQIIIGVVCLITWSRTAARTFAAG